MIEEKILQPVVDHSDQEVIDKILSGEKRAFEILIRKYNSRLFKIGMSLVNNDTDVEDIMQVCFIKAYKNLSQFENRSAFGTWLVRILINECLLHLKRKKRTISMDTNLISESSGNVNQPETPSSVLVNKELAKLLEDSLARLPEKYRLVFVMREIENMSVAETGAALSVSESNVKTRLNRAKSMLRRHLSSYYKDDAVYHFHLSRCDSMVRRVFSELQIELH